MLCEGAQLPVYSCNYQKDSQPCHTGDQYGGKVPEYWSEATGSDSTEAAVK